MKLVQKILNFFLIIIITIPFKVLAVENKDLYIDEINLLPEYSVDLIWGNMEFTYVESDEYVFNNENNEYVLNTTGSWISNSNAMTINNNSNFSIEVNIHYQSISSYNNITGMFSYDNAIISSGESFSTALYLNGKLEKSVVDFIKIGAITIEIV